jgi:hypothetical protein
MPRTSSRILNSAEAKIAKAANKDAIIAAKTALKGAKGVAKESARRQKMHEKDVAIAEKALAKLQK